MANQTQVSLLRICTFRHIVPLIFLWGERPRAQRRKLNIKWPTKFKLFFWKSALFVKSSSHFSMRWEKPRAQLGNFHIKWQTKLNFPHWKSALLVKSSSHFSMRWERPRAQLGKCRIKWPTKLIFSSLKIGNCRQIVPLIFLWDEKGSARAARKCFQMFSIHNLLSISFWIS